MTGLYAGQQVLCRHCGDSFTAAAPAPGTADKLIFAAHKHFVEYRTGCVMRRGFTAAQIKVIGDCGLDPVDVPLHAVKLLRLDKSSDPLRPAISEEHVTLPVVFIDDDRVDVVLPDGRRYARPRPHDDRRRARPAQG